MVTRALIKNHYSIYEKKDMDLDAVALFVEVVKAGSFSAAARHTHTPVATVSRRISELEKSLDIRLLERSSRHLRMTDAGSVLYEYAARGVEELHAGLLASSFSNIRRRVDTVLLVKFFLQCWLIRRLGFKHAKA